MALDTSNPKEVRDAARQILSRPEFGSYRKTWWQQAIYYVQHPVQFFDDAFSWFVDALYGHAGNRVVAWAIAGVLATAVILLVIRFTRSTSSDNVVPVRYAPAPATKSAEELLAEAKRFEAQGKFRQAVRMRYAALLAELSGAGVIKQRPGRTTGEYVQEVAANVPMARERFVDATKMFEWVWYGEGQPQSADVERFQAVAADVHRRVAA